MHICEKLSQNELILVGIFRARHKKRHASKIPQRPGARITCGFDMIEVQLRRVGVSVHEASNKLYVGASGVCPNCITSKAVAATTVFV